LKYEEMLAHLDNMAAKYPNLITIRKPIHNPQSGTDFETHQDRPIYYVKISDNVNTSESSAETQILYTALHHAREPASLSQLIFYMYYLLENYGKNDWVTHLVNNREMIFVPCINPDGYIYNQTTNPNGGGMWRKNRRANSGGSFGVDLNRNYSFQWGVSGASSDSNSDIYKGPSPFSEPETQAIQSLCKQFNFKMAFNYHTHGDLLLFPYGYGNTQAPDHNRYANLTEEMVAQNNYVNQQSVLLYAAAGDSDDYMYGNTTDKPRIFAMTPEVGDDFWIPQSAIVPVCKENLWQNISMGLQADVYPLLKTTTESLEQLTGNLNFTVEARGLNALTNAQLSVTSQTSALTIVSGVNIGDVNPFQVRTLAIPYTVAVGTPTGTPLAMTCTVSFNNGKTLTYPIKMIWKGTEAIGGQVIFEDDFTNVYQWTTTGSWGIATNNYTSEPSAITDSPAGNYNNYVNMKIDTRQTIDLRGMQTAYLTFKARWNIEMDDDYLQVTVVKNNIEYPVCGVYSRVNTSGRIVYDGNQNTWIAEQINLADFLGSEIKLRFRMKSDGASTSDGFYLDDVAVLVTPQQDAVPPTLVSISPESNVTTSIATDIVLTFSENILVAANDVKLKRDSDQVEIPATISVQDSIITITPTTPLQYATTYYVAIAANAITDLAGNYFAGIDDTTWTCTTEVAPDVTAPQIQQVFPAAGAMDVSEDVVITATFNETVQIVSQTIHLVTGTSQSVPATITIENHTTLTVAPNELLQSGTTYTVQIPINSIEDLSGNNFSGLTQPWTFTTQMVTGVGRASEPVMYILPNPARVNAFIHVSSTASVRHIHMSDLLGRTVPVAWKAAEENRIELIVQNVKAGIYILQVQHAAGQTTLRLIKE
jgi:carboxypeptidase T